MKKSGSYEYLLKEILRGGSRNLAQYGRATPLNLRLGITSAMFTENIIQYSKVQVFNLVLVHCSC